MTARTDDDILRLDNQLCFAVYAATHAFNRVYKPLLEALDLTYPQYLVMLTLWEEDNLTVTEIGQRLHLDSGTLTPLLKRMESAGLLSRRRDAADERKVRVALTGEGGALRRKADRVPRAVLRASGRSMASLRALKSELVALRDSLNAAAL